MQRCQFSDRLFMMNFLWRRATSLSKLILYVVVTISEFNWITANTKTLSFFLFILFTFFSYIFNDSRSLRSILGIRAHNFFIKTNAMTGRTTGHSSVTNTKNVNIIKIKINNAIVTFTRNADAAVINHHFF